LSPIHITERARRRADRSDSESSGAFPAQGQAVKGHMNFLIKSAGAISSIVPVFSSSTIPLSHKRKQLFIMQGMQANSVFIIHHALMARSALNAG
jgi:hypothetical protein